MENNDTNITPERMNYIKHSLEQAKRLDTIMLQDAMYFLMQNATIDGYIPIGNKKLNIVYLTDKEIIEVWHTMLRLQNMRK